MNGWYNRELWYALALAIIKDITPDEAMCAMKVAPYSKRTKQVEVSKFECIIVEV